MLDTSTISSSSLTSLPSPSSTALVSRARYLICTVGLYDQDLYTSFVYTNDENHWSTDHCWGDELTSSTLGGRVKTGFDYEGGSWFLVVQFRLY